MSDLLIQFIYNAQSGKLHALFDIAHKVLSPQTYSCDLCQLTHDAFTENAEFTTLKSRHPIELFHIDEYEARYPAEDYYPVIVVRRNGEVVKRVNRERIGQLRSVDDLKSLIEGIEAAES